MIRYSIIILISLIPIGLIAQTDCKDFSDYDSSQIWIKEIIKLKNEAKKDSIIKRIKCERILGEQNVKFSLTCIFGGLVALNIPEYRDSILNQIDSQNMQLFSSLCETEGIYPDKCNLGFLIINGLKKPIVDNVDELTIKKINRKKGTIKIIVKSLMSGSYDFRIEDFSNRDNYTTDKKHLKKGRNKIVLSVDKELKIISLIDNENKLVMIK